MANGHGYWPTADLIFALADSDDGLRRQSAWRAAVVQHASISFIRPVHVGDILVADATERMHAGRSGIYECLGVSTMDGELVADFAARSRGRFAPSALVRIYGV